MKSRSQAVLPVLKGKKESRLIERGGSENADMSNQHYKRKRDLYPYSLLSPALIGATLIILVPMLFALGLSFMNYVLYRPQDHAFVALQNYRRALGDEIFWLSVRNTFIWVIGVIALQVLLGFITALFLNRRFWWRGIARSLILIPWVTPSVITALMWRFMLDGNTGVINDLLVRLGFLNEYVPWLARSSSALPSVMIALMWQGFPFFSVMILAGLQAIPQELYEVAEVDGAKVHQKFYRITLPLVMPILLTAVLLRTIWVANSLDIIFIMTGGGPGYSTYTLPLYSYIRAYSGLDFGYASTLAVYLTIILVMLIAAYVIRVMRTEDLH